MTTASENWPRSSPTARLAQLEGGEGPDEHDGAMVKA